MWTRPYNLKEQVWMWDAITLPSYIIDRSVHCSIAGCLWILPTHTRNWNFSLKLMHPHCKCLKLHHTYQTNPFTLNNNKHIALFRVIYNTAINYHTCENQRSHSQLHSQWLHKCISSKNSSFQVCLEGRLLIITPIL